MTLPRHIAALLDPAGYPGRPASISISQTHISYLLFTPKHVYKVKKPVNFGFLDFTTLERRRYYCGVEVSLNRRLAPRIYIGVVPITERKGRIRMEGKGGKVLDYAVKMKRIPRETFLEEMIKREAVTPATIKRVSERIASFHKGAGTNPYISGFGGLDVIRKNTEENFSQTEAFKGKVMTARLHRRIRRYTRDFMRDNETLFLSRVSGGFIRDCHGDIHSEQVSISNGIDIIDCIEFNERFRFSDVVSDAGFLSMDLDWRGRGDLSRVFEKTYFEKTRDRQGKKLLDFYKCYRAYVRGKVEGFKSIEPEVERKDRAASYLKARRYFHLAGQYAEGAVKPGLVIVRGLSGTGKSTLAKAISDETGAALFSSDAVRKELAGARPGEHRFERFEAGIYSRQFTERTYRTLIDRGLSAIRSGRSAVLDATFSKKRFIEAARKKAFKAGLTEKSFHVVECSAPDRVIRRRFVKRLKEERVSGTGTVSDMSWGLFKSQKRGYEKLPGRRISLDATRPLGENLRAVIDSIYSC